MIYNVYWGDKPKNFGDVLTANLLNYFSISYKHTNDFLKANLFCIGSIARLATSNSLVLGSGVIRQGEKIDPKVNFKFVRGPLTRENIISQGGVCPPIYCDPALLLPLFCDESKKEYDTGLVPHYQDYQFVKKMYPTHNVINVVNDDPIKVAKEITKCRKIISSSLHGIICASAYGIPSTRVKFSKLHGDGIKFLDFYKSVGIEDPVISTVERPVYSLGKIKPLNNIIDIFNQIQNDSSKS